MKGITIFDKEESRNVLSFDLKDILHLIRDLVVKSKWIAVNVDSYGINGAEELNRASAENLELSGDELIKLAERVDQVVDGEFKGHISGEKEPWIIIRAVDSSAFDVQTDDEAVLGLLIRNFKKVEKIPE